MSTAPAPPRTNGSASSPADRIDRLFAAQRSHAPSVRATDVAQRSAKIRRLRDAVYDRRDAIRQAMHEDFRRPAPEVDLTEVKSVADEATFALDHLEDWMREEAVPTPRLLLGTRSEIRYQPKGVVLIISPWNYPFNLTLGPLVAALAAGNCVMIKPSEYTPHSSAVMREMIDDLYDDREVALVEGDASVAQTLLDQPFDHIYFTGSPEVGSLVMQAAAKHHASVTLELGGKSPTIVDETADVDDAASKIAWGKFTNCGQTCIAPDFVLAHDRVVDELVDGLRAAIDRAYGDTPEARRRSPDYARIVNDKHFQRVHRLLSTAIDDGATTAAGGVVDAAERYIAPTVLTDVPPDTSLMQEEIFGPVLPVLSYRSVDDVLADLRSRPNPLALYLFTESAAREERILNETSAGGTAINDVLLHYMNPHLPFGGAGRSGIGHGHGLYAFREFSHARSVLRRSGGSSLMKQAYPPYTRWTKTLINWVMKLF